MMILPFFAADPPALALLRAWPLWLPLLAGAASIYLLLPRPRPYPGWMGGLVGVGALVLAGLFLIKPLGLSPETGLFYCFAAMAVASASLLATQRDPARAALSFTLVVLSTCGLFLLLAAPFLMAATIIVYAGAIIVTFLFVIMLAQQQGYSDADSRSREPALAVLTGFLLLGVILHVVRIGYDTHKLDGLLERVAAFKTSGEQLPPGKTDAENDLETATAAAMRELGYTDLRNRADSATDLASEKGLAGPALAASVMDTLRSVLIDAKGRQGMARPRAALLDPAERQKQRQENKASLLSGFSGTPADTPEADRRRNPGTGFPEMPGDNAAALGKSLFTDYLLAVELGGFLLLAATVGAIAIAQRKPATKDMPGGTP